MDVEMFSGRHAQQLWMELMQEIDQSPVVVPCTNTDPELWFPDDNDTESSTRTRYRIARQLCNQCPVKAKCLEYALAQPEYDGMWGGLAPAERKLLRRK